MRLVLLAMLLFTLPASADEYVKPHVRSDGTYVDGHMRSSPNAQRFDNYSSQGNSNPYTGQRGHERNEFSNPPERNTGHQTTPRYETEMPRQQSNPYGTTPNRRNSPY